MLDSRGCDCRMVPSQTKSPADCGSHTAGIENGRSLERWYRQGRTTGPVAICQAAGCGRAVNRHTPAIQPVWRISDRCHPQGGWYRPRRGGTCADGRRWAAGESLSCSRSSQSGSRCVLPLNDPRAGPGCVLLSFANKVIPVLVIRLTLHSQEDCRSHCSPGYRLRFEDGIISMKPVYRCLLGAD